MPRAPSQSRRLSMAELTKREQQTIPYLTPQQQNLLVAALSSQAQPHTSTVERPDAVKRSDSDLTTHPNTMPTNANGDALFVSPQAAELDNLGLDYTPGLDYLDDDGFDFENADVGGELIGPLPGSEGHEKRKSREDSVGTEHDAKRQETNDGEKAQKKPGRKPLTSEPTTVSPQPLFSSRPILTVTAEEKGAKPCRAKSVPRAKGEASEGPRREGHLSDQVFRGGEARKRRVESSSGALASRIARISQAPLFEQRRRAFLSTFESYEWATEQQWPFIWQQLPIRLPQVRSFAW